MKNTKKTKKHNKKNQKEEEVGVACPQRVRLGHFIIQPEAAGNSEDSRVTSPFRRGGPVRAGGPSRHPRPQGNDQFDPRRSRVVRVATSSPYVVLADLGWSCRTGASLSPPQKSRKETKRGRGRRQDTKAQKPTRRAQAAGGRAGDDPGSTPRPTHTHRTAPHRPRHNDARSRPGQAVEACEVTF